MGRGQEEGLAPSFPLHSPASSVALRSAQASGPQVPRPAASGPGGWHDSWPLVLGLPACTTGGLRCAWHSEPAVRAPSQPVLPPRWRGQLRAGPARPPLLLPSPGAARHSQRPRPSLLSFLGAASSAPPGGGGHVRSRAGVALLVLVLQQVGGPVGGMSSWAQVLQGRVLHGILPAPQGRVAAARRVEGECAVGWLPSPAPASRLTSAPLGSYPRSYRIQYGTKS